MLLQILVHHIFGNLGSRENILKAKLEILEGSKQPKIVINNDNDLLHNWYEKNKKNKEIYTYGLKEKSYINAENIILQDESSEFECNIYGKRIKVKVPVGGEHFVLNAICAVTIGEVLKIDSDKIVEGIEKFELTKKRMDITEKVGVKIINDAYNASLESMKASLEYLSELKGKRKIAILGDMFELGDYAKKIHQEVGKQIYKNNIDMLFCSGENAKYIVKQAEEEGMPKENIYYMSVKEDIIRKMKEIMREGDVILVKASNGMKFYDIPEELIKLLGKKMSV